MIAMPSEPPTWRMLFRTAEPTPALSRRTEPIAAAVVGVIVRRHPDAAEDHRREERPEASSLDAMRRRAASETETRQQPAADERARADPVGQPPGLRRDAG